MSFYDDMRPTFNEVTNYANFLGIPYDITTLCVQSDYYVT